jgi:hypothetical protein
MTRQWWSDPFSSLYYTFWLFFSICISLVDMWTRGAIFPGPSSSSGAPYLIGLALLVFYHAHAFSARFKGYKFNFVACWLAALVLLDVWVAGGLAGARDFVLLATAALVLVPSIWVQVAGLGRSLFSREGFRILLITSWVFALGFVLPVVIPFVLRLFGG